MGHDPLALVFFLFLLVLIPPRATSQPHTNVTLGSSLVAGEGSSWLSPSGDFAFGFYSISYGFLLGIWFNKIPRKTIVWSANRESPVQARSRVDLTSDGRLELFNSSGNLKWKAEATDVAYAAMLDNGNFVLVGRNSSQANPFFTWQSFEHPTDTILPSQVVYVKLNETHLNAQLSDTNISEGHFTLRVQSDGHLVFYTLDTKGQTVKYWSTDKQNGSRLVFNEAGSIYWVRLDETILQLSTGPVYPTTDFYQRAILEYDGVFRQYIYPKDETNKGDWRMVWHLPENICNIQNNPPGRGACGYNTICRTNNSRSICVCVPGHSYINPKDTRGGCIRDTVGWCDSPFEIVDLPDVNWPDVDLDWYDDSDEKTCQKSCEDDCLCDVAVYQNKGCRMKMFPMANGREAFTTPPTKAFVKVWSTSNSSNTTKHMIKDNGKAQGLKPWLIATLAILGISALLNGILLLQIFSKTIYFLGRRMPTVLLVQQDESNTIGTRNLHYFSFKTLEEATCGFSKELGRGSFGTVYEGTMIFSHREVSIAVKRLDLWKVTDGEKEFQTEVDVIGQTHHKNLVKLLGYCNEGDHRLLVYEFMCNGSLASYLFGETKPTWSKRVHISVAIAKGLTYLHEECHNPVIHCDIKSQNVLLDDNYEAKISDFGLAKLLKKDQSRTYTDIRGTRGYVAPEWFRNGVITTKVDVYSFGIMLMEIISCRRSFEPEMEEIGAAILVDWVCDCYYKRRLDLLVGGDEEAMVDMRRLEKIVVVAIWCVEEDATFRPSMRNVALMLEGLMDVPPPLNPSSVG